MFLLFRFVYRNDFFGPESVCYTVCQWSTGEGEWSRPPVVDHVLDRFDHCHTMQK